MSSETMCILCRGTSMKLADKYFKDFKDMIIVNEFNQEIGHDFVQRIFDGKNITHIVSRDIPSILNPSIYVDYVIKNVILNIFQEEYQKGTPVRGILRSLGMNTSCLTEGMKPFQKEGGGFPTTGMISIVYSVVALQKKDIHVAGMDFYQKNYFIDQKPTEHQVKKGKLMVEYITKFAQKHPDVNFTFYTHSSFKGDSENVRIIKE